MNTGLDRLARDISSRIEEELNRSGIFFRIFSRAKSIASIESKLNKKNYENQTENKKMQDLIGVRIAVYFVDDLPVVYQAIKNRFNLIDETIDVQCVNIFEPERINLIIHMNTEDANEVCDLAVSKYKYIDTTYEVQLRTILSEGWHEVEHDLRYKCPEDWIGLSDISHIFNGVYASLVTSDWTIMAIFEKIAYSHFKNKNWEAMLRNKFRLRFNESTLDSRITEILNNDLKFSKEIFKTDRNFIIKSIFNDRIRVPLTLTNLIHIINAYCFKDDRITYLAPDYIKFIYKH